MNKPKRRSNEHRPTRDGRVPTLVRLKPATLRRLSTFAKRDGLTRAAMHQRALDEWIAAKAGAAA